MRRDGTVALDLTSDGPAERVLAIGVADPLAGQERFAATEDGRPVAVRTLDDIRGGRLHVLDVQNGAVRIDYSATVENQVPHRDGSVSPVVLS